MKFRCCPQLSIPLLQILALLVKNIHFPCLWLTHIVVKNTNLATLNFCFRFHICFLNPLIKSFTSDISILMSFIHLFSIIVCFMDVLYCKICLWMTIQMFSYFDLLFFSQLVLFTTATAILLGWFFKLVLLVFVESLPTSLNCPNFRPEKRNSSGYVFTGSHWAQESEVYKTIGSAEAVFSAQEVVLSLQEISSCREQSTKWLPRGLVCRLANVTSEVCQDHCLPLMQEWERLLVLLAF